MAMSESRIITVKEAKAWGSDFRSSGSDFRCSGSPDLEIGARVLELVGQIWRERLDMYKNFCIFRVDVHF
ncbi:hypothetical protein R1sor_021783 [Riccia sorocarpa]|uniref:Uncharacterized protein n=1 Tax=Riccia sorocarpa TaxID=122646 RepID=A0ABD3GI00_9MARC